MPNTKCLELRLSEKQYRLISELADASNKSVNAICISILECFFESRITKITKTRIEKKRLKLRVSKELYNLVSALAGNESSTINSTCIDIFRWYFENGTDNT